MCHQVYQESYDAFYGIEVDSTQLLAEKGTLDLLDHECHRFLLHLGDRVSEDVI